MSDNDHDKEIRSPNAPDLPSKSEIVKLCRKNGLRTFYLTHTHNGTELFIKYLKASVLEKHGSNSSSSISRLPPPKKKVGFSISIPEIYLAFKDMGDYYMVMEYIDIDHDRVASDEQRAIVRLSLFNRLQMQRQGRLGVGWLCINSLIITTSPCWSIGLWVLWRSISTGYLSIIKSLSSALFQY